MKKAVTLLAAAALACGAADGLRAQSGFALKGHYVFNQSKVDDARDSGFEDIPSSDGFSLGAEFVLPLGIGVGIAGYTEGKATEFNTETSSFGVIGEANYFYKIPILPVSAYAGLHAGLGRYTIDEVGDTSPKIEDSRTQLGFQLGVRVQATRNFAIDGQFRHMSDSASESQSPDLERNQFWIGVAIF
ncbi:MAG TPA: outer membrane beta-barrel protein [Longimicrobium sp.]|jgi:opacity protein-like surface antigen